MQEEAKPLISPVYFHIERFKLSTPIYCLQHQYKLKSYQGCILLNSCFIKLTLRQFCRRVKWADVPEDESRSKIMM